MSTSAVAIEAGRILAGRDLETIVDGVVVVADGRVAAVGPRGSVGAPEHAERVDASELLVVPGFIDAHVHIGFFEPLEVLRGGVTTVRDLAWPPEVIFPLAARSTEASFAGPTILAAGPMLTVPQGYPERAGWAPRGTGAPLTSAEQARQTVTELARRGAAVIKIALNPPAGPVLDDATLEAIVDAAHSHGLKVTGHISGHDQLIRAIAAGVDELAHMLMSDEHIPEETLTAMVAADMTVVPTLSIRAGRDRARAIDNLRRFVQLGGQVVYGTDLGNEGPRPGIDPLEVSALAEAQMSAREIIASATTRSAKWLGLEKVGVIAPGADADLVALPRAALDEPLKLCDVAMVWRRGRRVR